MYRYLIIETNYNCQCLISHLRSLSFRAYIRKTTNPNSELKSLLKLFKSNTDLYKPSFDLSNYSNKELSNDSLYRYLSIQRRFIPEIEPHPNSFKELVDRYKDLEGRYIEYIDTYTLYWSTKSIKEEVKGNFTIQRLDDHSIETLLQKNYLECLDSPCCLYFGKLSNLLLNHSESVNTTSLEQGIDINKLDTLLKQSGHSFINYIN